MIIQIVLAICVMLCGLTGQLLAQESPKVASGDVELAHSKAIIRVDKARVGHVHAVMGKLKSGQLRLRAADDPKIEPGTLVFDMTSFDADTKEARDYLGMEEPSMRALASKSTKTCSARPCWMCATIQRLLSWPRRSPG